jgi:NAD(P)-dependent dehydrogenase (short-subunit alcohol dehydrogenase family)
MGGPPVDDPGRLLADKVVLVTGAGGGVGEGIAKACAAHGAAVVIAARRTETGDPVAQAIAEAGGRARSVRCDVAVRTDVDDAVAAAVEAYGGLDCIVHNALSPVGAPGPVQDVGAELWGSMMATAVRASFSCAQAGFPHLQARGGSLILLTSAAGVEGSPYLPAYSVVKAAQRGFAKSLAREWGPLGVRVNCISPVAMTPAMERTYASNPVLEDRLTGRTPMRRIGEPQADIGGVAVFLASDLARYVTGQTVTVDGGGFMGL